MCEMTEEACEEEDLKMGDMVPCEGVCGSSFHSVCLGLKSVPTNFKCDQCTSSKFDLVIFLLLNNNILIS